MKTVLPSKFRFLSPTSKISRIQGMHKLSYYHRPVSCAFPVWLSILCNTACDILFWSHRRALFVALDMKLRFARVCLVYNYIVMRNFEIDIPFTSSTKPIYTLILRKVSSWSNKVYKGVSNVSSKCLVYYIIVWNLM